MSAFDLPAIAHLPERKPLSGMSNSKKLSLSNSVPRTPPRMLLTFSDTQGGLVGGRVGAGGVVISGCVGGKVPGSGPGQRRDCTGGDDVAGAPQPCKSILTLSINSVTGL